MPSLRSKRSAAALAATALVATGFGVAHGAGAAASTATVTNLRTGGHSTYDRAVIDFRGKRPHVSVTIVNSLYSCGRGDRLSIPGDKIVRIDLTPARAHDSKGRSTYNGPGRTATATVNLTSIKGVRVACDFEGHVTFGIGVKNVRKVTWGLLSDPQRLYVDVKR